jgi:hypothetical protein
MICSRGISRLVRVRDTGNLPVIHSDIGGSTMGSCTYSDAASILILCDGVVVIVLAIIYSNKIYNG